MAAKKGTIVHKTGTVLHRGGNRPGGPIDYAAVVAMALRREFRNSNHATKTVMQWTGASERTVKYWFAGTRGPSGEHLSTLIAQSDVVLIAFLRLSGRTQALSQAKLTEIGDKFD